MMGNSLEPLLYGFFRRSRTWRRDSTNARKDPDQRGFAS